MRLFIAFEIPAMYEHFIIKSQEAIPAKAAFPKSFHLTLKFLGEVEEEKVGSLINKLEEVRFDPLKVNFSGISCFPNEKRPCIVWLALEPSSEICEIQKKIEAATSGFGVPQKKEFVPHVTIARIKRVENTEEFCKSLDKIHMPTDPFTLSDFMLVKSTLTPQGPEYEVLKAFSANN